MVSCNAAAEINAAAVIVHGGHADDGDTEAGFPQPLTNLRAIAAIYHPEPKLRRQKTKERERERNAEAIRRTDTLLDSTGIRELRRKPVFTTPNYFPPQGFDALGNPQPAEANGATQADDPSRESSELLHCYVCKN